MLQIALAVSPAPTGGRTARPPPPPAPPSGPVLCCRFIPIISGCLSWLPGLGSRILHELRTTCPFFSRGTFFSSRMFRTKRSLLVRRLWRSRAPGGEEEGGELGEGGTDRRAHGAGGGGGGGSRGCCMGKSGKVAKAHVGSETELKAVTHSVLKRLKEKHLEGLLQAVESRGGTRTSCLLLPTKVDSKLGQHWYSLPLLLCKVFRWPDLRHWSEVKRLCCCESYGKTHPDLVCCNPYHLSRLCELESPPPPYSRYPMDFLKPTANCPDSVPSSTETGGTNYLAPGGLSDSQVLQEPGDPSHWCVVAYWEEKTRVGRLYSVQEPSLDIFYDLPQGNGFCLGQLNSDNKSQLVQKVRSKIGYGIQLTKEVDGVWVYNRSSYPIFIKSATLDNPDSRTLLVHKVFPGFSIKAFDYEKAYSLQRPNDHEFMQQPWTGFTVQISFVKGWGQCYTRQFISSCPCWLEVIFNNR
ncbi:mothers against decapentaplegic homolog 7 isoform X1 [Rhineura floridana]|uniref:mothers against decapentaplegic homolog 7 isoform X1 n=2 Tax=Rhineura floridana TaxID=261503 RepID=UPI002AC83AD7|nr:mothers against decapentaplegic homolog 7 isoform X1 [Rhineura floridana]XP_061470267.1 mothers against decapentaplegic homolog 7 isoform X1 [Rhineura floridana]